VGEKKLILCGFHEAALAAFAIKQRIEPDRKVHVQYTTTSGELAAMRFRMSVAILLLLTACAADEKAVPEAEISGTGRPDIVATNAFYYYADVERAWSFYQDTLGLETVVDYGFAKIMRLADSSYLTLVQASEGMHSTDEPKTVTLTLVTDELNRWHTYLAAKQVPMKAGILAADGQAANSFVAIDPEGYFLRFIRYNPHPNHASFVAAIADAPPVFSNAADAAAPMSIRATAFSAYFEDLEAVRPFYESLFEVVPSGQLNGVDAYQMSASGYLLLVGGGDELHEPTRENGVTLSFITTDVDGWFERASGWPGFELRTPEIFDESGMVRVFVGYDPEGIFLEWDTFLKLAENEAMLKYLP
jgi:predicted enzyme related to lactoylglutathione lyase